MLYYLLSTEEYIKCFKKILFAQAEKKKRNLPFLLITTSTEFFFYQKVYDKANRFSSRIILTNTLLFDWKI